MVLQDFINPHFLILLLLNASCTSTPTPAISVTEPLNISTNISQTKPASLQQIDRLRQDGDEGTEVAEAVSNVDGLGSVANIINGVLTGSIENIFKGAAGFIEEEDVRKGVGGILSGFANPFNKIFGTGLNRTKEYFGLTPSTTPRVLIIYKNLTSPPKKPSTIILQSSTTLSIDETTEPTEAPAPIPLILSSPTVSTTSTSTDDDEDELESES